MYGYCSPFFSPEDSKGLLCPVGETRRAKSEISFGGIISTIYDVNLQYNWKAAIFIFYFFIKINSYS